MEEEWTSPDDKIFKKVLLPGKIGLKPYDSSTIKLNIVDCPDILTTFNNKNFIVGENDGDLGRMMDICVCTMNLNEKAQFTITVDLEQITAIIELIELHFEGFIFQWDANKRYEIALKHKEKGAQYFAEHNEVEAAYRFTKALKVISSIPLDVENIPYIIDGVPLADIIQLKEKLYNNLASCYFKGHVYDMVIPLCAKVLSFDENNVKALYKLGVAYEQERNFEKAYECLKKALEIEPQNKACAEHLTNINKNLKQADVRVNDMMRKMIAGSLSK